MQANTHTHKIKKQKQQHNSLHSYETNNTVTGNFNLVQTALYKRTMRSLAGDRIPKREETLRPIPESMPWPWGSTCWWIFPELSGINLISWLPTEDRMKLPPCEETEQNEPGIHTLSGWRISKKQKQKQKTGYKAWCGGWWMPEMPALEELRQENYH